VQQPIKKTLLRALKRLEGEEPAALVRDRSLPLLGAVIQVSPLELDGDAGGDALLPGVSGPEADAEVHDSVGSLSASLFLQLLGSYSLSGCLACGCLPGIDTAKLGRLLAGDS